jgi:hypothetical protein
MVTDEILIEKVKKSIEERMGWGDSSDWTNQDFVALSEKILEQTDVSLSHVTLKRIWGKVKYESLPNTHTLNVLVQFVGYENWRDFRFKHGNGNGSHAEKNGNGVEHLPVKNEVAEKPLQNPEITVSTPARKFLKPAAVILGTVLAAGFVVFMLSTTSKINPADYSFSSKKVVVSGLPNTVIFDFDATKAPTDSVIIQQSWDKKLRTKVSKNQHHYSSLYYFPDFYKAKLIVNDQIVKEHNILIKSDGWLIAAENSPVPVYFEKTDVFADGKMHLPLDKITAKNLTLQPKPPIVLYSNVQELGDIMTDNFVFETSVRNDYKEGAASCQPSNIFILGEATAIAIPLSARGCVSEAQMYFAGTQVSGKTSDMSAFGVDFKDFVKVRIVVQNGKGQVFINDKLAYEIAKIRDHAKIVGVDFTFQGTGTVDYVRLTNGKVNFVDEF